LLKNNPQQGYTKKSWRL